MGRKSKVDFKALGGQNVGCQNTSDRTALINGSIDSSTLGQYRSAFKQIVAFAKGRNPSATVVDQDCFFAFLISISSSQTNIERYRSALVHMQLSGEEHDGVSAGSVPWGQAPHVKKACRGAKYRSGELKREASSVPPRGMVTEQMLLELLQWIRDRNPQLILPFRILFYADLRPGELVRLRRGDFVPSENNPSSGLLLIRGDKRSKADGKFPPTYQKEILCPEAIEALREAESAVESGQPLFPYGTPAKGGWNRETLSAVLKEAKNALGWNPDLHYVPHSLRHGGAAMLLDRGLGTQMSASMEEHYTRSNGQRISNKIPVRAKKTARSE